MLDTQKISELIAGGESVLVEFKQTISSSTLESARKTVCAFSNDISATGQTGHLLFGVSDDGQVLGVQHGDREQQLLAQIRSDGSIVPTPSLTIEEISLGDATLLVIAVTPSSSPPVRYKGTAWIRVGTTASPATPDDERRLVSQRANRNRPFDVRGLDGTSKDDLDTNRFLLEYLPSAVSVEVLQENGRSMDQQLSSLKLTDSEGLATPAGLLTVGIDPLRQLPGAYIQFRRVAGTRMTDDTLDEARFSGTIDVMVREAEEKLKAHNVSALTIGPEQHERQDLYPLRALNQLVRNAMMHRDYEMTAPVRITWFSDRIEILSPGGPFGIAPDEFGKPGVTSYRNPNIAEVMRNIGLAEKFGVGIELARIWLAENGNPDLELAPSPNFTNVIVRAS